MKKIEQALNLAQAEIRALYKRVGYSDSSVLTLIDEALEQVKTCNKPAVSNNEVALIALLKDIKFSYEVTGGIMPQEMDRLNKAINDC